MNYPCCLLSISYQINYITWFVALLFIVTSSIRNLTSIFWRGFRHYLCYQKVKLLLDLLLSLSLILRNPPKQNHYTAKSLQKWGLPQDWLNHLKSSIMITIHLNYSTINLSHCLKLIPASSWKHWIMDPSRMGSDSTEKNGYRMYESDILPRHVKWRFCLLVWLEW